MKLEKTVVVGVTGGIAAYKTADLVSRMAKSGADVHVIMTRNATKFITPLTFRTLSGNPVLVDSFEENSRWKVQHIGIAEAADILVVCPATANIIAKMAHGLADDLLSTVVLAIRAPVLVVPAMNTNMYDNRIVQDNIGKLRAYGLHILEPEEGKLACGADGKGRLPDVDIILREVVNLLSPRQDFAGKTVIVTSGPTREAIDPVRFISNRSTGKMGHALAKAAAVRGARVILVSGPTSLEVPSGVEYVPVTSAQEMYDRVCNYYGECDVVIGAAAVADYRPAKFSQQKVKKGEGELFIELTRNPDILAELGKNKGNRILVGFAAETQDLINNAVDKLRKKNLDLLVANDVTLEGAGFAVDTNVVTIISRNGDTTPLPAMRKSELANVILDRVADLFKS